MTSISRFKRLPKYAVTCTLTTILISGCTVVSDDISNLVKNQIDPSTSINKEPDWQDDINWENEMLDQVNNVRADNKLDPVEICNSLMVAAQEYATLMLNTGHYDHIGPKGDSPSERALQAGYNWRSPERANPSGLNYQGIAENIAKGYENVSDVMEGWINSPGHFANLIAKDAIDVGFGFAFDENAMGEVYWVQNFGFGGTC